MNYQVMIVDDEPIILSGIQGLLDWSTLGCTITATARNGAEAYEIIKESQIDIVICDLKMPRMTGLELIKRVNEEFPQVVFIILTSLEEFKLAKEAVRYNAVDYLLKSELDERLLTEVMLRALEESKRRNNILSTVAVQKTQEDGVRSIIETLIQVRSVAPETKTLLLKNGILQEFAFWGVFMQLPEQTLEIDYDLQDYHRLFVLQKEIIEKILPSYAPLFHPVLPRTSRSNLHLYLLSQVSDEGWENLHTRGAEKIQNAAKLITGVSIKIVHSPRYHHSERLEEARVAIEDSCSLYYLEKEEAIIESFGVDEATARFERALKRSDLGALHSVMEYILTALRTRNHTKGQADFVLTNILTIAGQHLPLDENLTKEIEFLGRRSNVVTFTEELFCEIRTLLQPATSSRHTEIVESAQRYIHEHITEVIRLDEIANEVYVSPNYLSSVYKKVTGKSLIEYIHQEKVAYAKTLMEQSPSSVADVARQLGFENVYYFSKIFKKETGFPPSHYQRRME